MGRVAGWFVKHEDIRTPQISVHVATMQVCTIYMHVHSCVGPWSLRLSGQRVRAEMYRRSGLIATRE